MTGTKRATRADAPIASDGPRVDPGRPVDPKAAELRAEKNPLKRACKALGPGLITGASDDDPSGIGTYAQAGAQYGFATLWTTARDAADDDGRPVHVRQDRPGDRARPGGRAPRALPAGRSTRP